jgi:hypothetical protein
MKTFLPQISARHRLTAHAAIGVAALTLASASANGATVRAVEYYHTGYQHYFVTADPVEIAALDGGLVPDLYLTGLRYFVDDAPGGGGKPICRFFTAAFGLPTHFFTGAESECAALKANPDWTYEGIAFYAPLPDASGECPTGTSAIQRFFNNGHDGAPNHAYTPNPRKAALLARAGWASEGTAFCVPLAGGDAEEKLMELAGSTWKIPVSGPQFDDSFVTTVFATDTSPSSWESVYTFWGALEYLWELDPQRKIYHQANDAWRGEGAWDPIAGSYIVFGNSGFEGPPYEGIAWTFDNAAGPSEPVCVMDIINNFVDTRRQTLHAFQPQLLSGCTMRVVNRL